MFAPRRVYGEYISGLLQGEVAATNASFEHVRGEAVSLACEGRSARITLLNGATLEAERVVLALGNPVTGSRASGAPVGLEGSWHSSPWVGDGLRLNAPGQRILLLGAGHSSGAYCLFCAVRLSRLRRCCRPPARLNALTNARSR